MAIVLRNAHRKQITQVVRSVKELADPKWAEDAAHFGIHSKYVPGITLPQISALAKSIGFNHPLAAELWETEIQEARILTSLMAEPSQLTPKQMEHWAVGFENWAVCDACCCNLFDKTPLGWEKAIAWTRRNEEYVKRATFSIVAGLAVHDESASDTKLLRFLPLIERPRTTNEISSKKQ